MSFFQGLTPRNHFYNTMLCGVCHEKESKYTCPKCECRYCSLTCFKDDKHKEMDNRAIEKHPIKEDTSEDKSKEVKTEDIQDPMLAKLMQSSEFQEYIASPVLQFHILTVLEIINNISLTNEYSKDGRFEIASRKLNNLRLGGVEENEYVEEFVSWLLTWIENYKKENTTTS